MADLLDQYADITLHSDNINPRDGQGGFYQSGQEPISSGFVSFKIEDEVPIFHAKRVEFQALTSAVVDFQVSNNIAVIALANNTVRRCDLMNPHDVDSVVISKRPDDRIRRIFLDPSGRHLIISMKSMDVFYLGRNNKKPKPLQKLKNQTIEAVAWNKTKMSESTTGEILVGSSKGLVFELEIEAEEKFLLQMGSEKHFKQVYNVNENRDTEEPICGIQLEKFPGPSRKHFVMLVTPSRIFQFIGDVGVDAPLFVPLFSVYDPIPARFMELPGTLEYSDLKFYFPKRSPRLFAWLTGPGIYFGELNFSRSDAKDNITENTRLLAPKESKGESPVALSVTEFHCVMLYKDRFEAICTLNDETDFSETIPATYGQMMGMSMDPVRKTLWVFSETTILQYVITKESRNVWKMYLDREEFELAKDYCKDNPAQMDLLLRKQAEHFFTKKLYQEAASYYALTQISFEEVALKFMDVKHSEALKTFLLKRMVKLKQQAMHVAMRLTARMYRLITYLRQLAVGECMAYTGHSIKQLIVDSTQLTMLVTWVIELYLNQLGEQRDAGNLKIVENLQEEFQKFLAQSRVKSCLEENRQVAYDLLASHGDTENMIFFAVIMQDFDRVISHHVQQEDYISALDVLRHQKNKQLFYKFSPVLMQHIPHETVELWKQRDLEPRELIPALVTHDQTADSQHITEAVDYLEHCVYGLQNKEAVIHNYLISLYCKQADEAPLLRYLNLQGEDRDEVNYDLKYALRLCAEHGKEAACVHIYSTMCLYEEAVDLALKVDVEKAKIYAEKPEDDPALRRTLWLKIARNVIENQMDIQKAMSLLDECNLLKIEDVLPFFPDFVTIDQFKDAICKSLQDYNDHINDLKSAMLEATESAKVVRSEILEIRNRCGAVSAQEKCAVCRYPLLTRSFYYFPCSHVFHSDCLVAEVSKSVKARQRTKIEELHKKLSTISAQPNASGISLTSDGENLKEQLDELIASECLYCGDIMIRSLDKPFIALDEFDKVMQEWQ